MSKIDFQEETNIDFQPIDFQEETGGMGQPKQESSGFLKNLTTDISNIAKGTYQMARHPIQTGKQIAEYQLSKTELPEYLEDKPILAGAYGAGAAVAKTSWDVVKGMAYDITHPYEKPVSALLVASPLLKTTGQLATKVPILAKTGQTLKTVGRVTDPFDLTIQGMKMASKPIGWMGKQLTGSLTGKGVSNVEQWMKGSKDFFNVLHERLDETDIIANVKAGFQAVKTKRTAEYGQALKNLDMSQEIGFQGIDNTLTNIGRKFRFDKGIPTLNKAEMADFENIIKIIDDIKAQPAGSTALGLDSLKQQLDYFYTQNTRVSSIITDLRNTINKDIGSKIPAYTEMNKRYAQLTAIANDMEQTLIGKGNINTTFNKLQSAMREDAQLRRALMEEMKNLTGTDIQAQIAGFAGKPIMASGLVGRSVEFGLFAGVLAKYVNPKMLTLVLMSSPRAMSEFLGSIGWTKQQIAPLLQIQTKYSADVMRNGLVIYAKNMQEKLENKTNNQPTFDYNPDTGDFMEATE